MINLILIFVVLQLIFLGVIGNMVFQRYLKIENLVKSADVNLDSINNKLNIFFQDHLFKFQQSIQNQVEGSNKYNQFVYEEMEKNLNRMEQKLDEEMKEMRTIVDEKLHQTLEKRLGLSFKLVYDSLEKVQLGLGEMQNLAQGVGNLKKVLNNVKTRGVLGEVQLGNILEQILNSDQYSTNVSTIPHAKNHVEFAIKFPGKSEELPYIWLPIDAKFPLSYYEKLLDAYDEGEKKCIENSRKILINQLKKMAKEIQVKYIYPPYTTDFAIMFLPIEGLYAEVLRIPGLISGIQQEFGVMIVGPHNLSAFLSALQQGFKSIAIERRTEEVWTLLNVVKQEFGKFGDILSKTQGKILEANKIIEEASVKSRKIERSLNNMEKISFLEA